MTILLLGSMAIALGVLAAGFARGVVEGLAGEGLVEGAVGSELLCLHLNETVVGAESTGNHRPSVGQGSAFAAVRAGDDRRGGGRGAEQAVGAELGVGGEREDSPGMRRSAAW